LGRFRKSGCRLGLTGNEAVRKDDIGVGDCPFAPGRLWAIEIKRSLAPAVSKGFHSALRDLKPGAAWVVYPGAERYSTSPGIEVVPLVELMAELRGMRPGG
jgi:hypothetical protein